MSCIRPWGVACMQPTGGKVDDPKAFPVRNIAASVGRGLLYCEIVEFRVAAVFPIFIESEKRQARSLECYQLIAECHFVAEVFEIGAIDAVGVSSLIVVEISDKPQPYFPLFQLNRRIDSVVVKLLKPTEHGFPILFDDSGHEHGTLIFPSPHTSPFFMCLVSSSTVVTDSG